MNQTINYFLMIFGALMLVVLAVVLTGVLGGSTVSCVPEELYSDSEVVGFGGGLLDNVYDSACTSLLNANSAVWGLYKRIITGIIGQRENIASVSADLWGLARFFCRTNTNFEYVTQGSAGAISSTEIFTQLFANQVERCWSMFEGQKDYNSERNPLGRRGMFDCAEIIYDFSDSGDYVTLGQLYATLASENTCGAQRIIPIVESETLLFGTIYTNYIQWCAPKAKMHGYWNSTTHYSNPSYYLEPEEFEVSAGAVDRISCNLGGSGVIRPKNVDADVDACMPFSYALCSLSYVDGYKNTTLMPGHSTYTPNDDSTVIDNCGKIVISFFDYFSWGVFSSVEKNTDNYAGCGGLDVFNNFESFRIPGANIFLDKYISVSGSSDSIVICYERYDDCDFTD